MAPTTAPLTVAHLADQIHQASAGRSPASIVLVGRHRPSPAVEWWELPATAAHPYEVLVGWRAGPGHDVVGLVTRGTSRPVPAPGATSPDVPHPVRVTHLMDRDGATATVLDGLGRSTLIETPPEGLVADALARVLGRPTPPPELTVGTLVETGWLDAVAQVAFHGPEQLRSWSQVAQLHPLAGCGPTPSADHLAGDVRELEATSSWSRLRRLSRIHLLTSSRPPGGGEVSPADWFDDGSFARWSTRNMPDAGEVLASLIEVLPLGVTAQLCRALTAVVLPDEADAPWWDEPDDGSQWGAS